MDEESAPAGPITPVGPDADEPDEPLLGKVPETAAADETSLGAGCISIEAPAGKTSWALPSDGLPKPTTHGHAAEELEESSSEQLLKHPTAQEEIHARLIEDGTFPLPAFDDPDGELVAATAAEEQAQLNPSTRPLQYWPSAGLSGEAGGAEGCAPAIGVEVVTVGDLKHIGGHLETAVDAGVGDRDDTGKIASRGEGTAESHAADDGTDAIDAGPVADETARSLGQAGEPLKWRDAAVDGSAADAPPRYAGPETNDGDPPPDLLLAAVDGERSGEKLLQSEGVVGSVVIVEPECRRETGLASFADETDPSSQEAEAAPAQAAGDAASRRTAPPDAVTDEVRRRPRAYRPRLSRARGRRAPAAAAPTVIGDIQSLGADLQLLIGASDWGVDLSALLRMPAGAADGIAVEHEGMERWLGQLDDELLEPLQLTDASAAFGEPLLVTAVSLSVRWSRTSRDLHILGPDHRVAGFVSQPRVVIGQESVVICRGTLSGAARAQILATGSAEPIGIEGPNVPEGWVCWRGVRPLRPSLPVGGQSILDALDPLPAVGIEFSGGIQLRRGVWLEGHPPSVRLLGLLSEGDPVQIDGRTASMDGDGGWVAHGWDAPGAHTVDHGGKSAGYRIEFGAEGWDWWAAWEGATHLAGALSDGGGVEFFHVGDSAVLLGARPGQICGFAPSASSIGVARPDFEPVWLLTAGVGTRRTTASSVGLLQPPGVPTGPPTAVERWVRAICYSGRAGTERSAERVAWNLYVAASRSQRKRRR